MGSIKKNDKTGKWEFAFSAGIDPFTGKRKQIRRRGFKTKREASIEMARLQIEIAENSFLELSSITYGRYLDEYLKEKKITLQKSTFEIQSMYARNVLIPKLGSLKLQKISPIHIQKFVNDLVQLNMYSAHTIHTIYRVLFGSLKRAHTLKLIKDNPCIGTSLPKRKKREMSVWSLEQVNYFLQEAHKVERCTRCLIGFQLGLLTGMRQGEILGLRWQDIDFENQVIYVRQTLTQDAEIKVGAKNESSIRSISIPQKLIEALKEHKDLIEWEKPRCREGYIDNDLVLPTRKGTPMIPRNFRIEFYNLIKKLGLPKIRFHDTRHTHATLLIEQNVHIKLISERLGHADIETTLNTYSHVLPSMQKIVADKIDEIIKF